MASPKTFLPSATPQVPESPKKENCRGIRPEGLFRRIGAADSALSTTALLFGWFTPLTGGIGYVVVSYILFLVFYVMLTSFGGRRRNQRPSGFGFALQRRLHSCGSIAIRRHVHFDPSTTTHV
jgi:hypothetical protein